MLLFCTGVTPNHIWHCLLDYYQYVEKDNIEKAAQHQTKENLY